MECMICGEKVNLCEHLSNVPIRGASFEKTKKDMTKGYNIDYFCCPRCGHGQIPYLIPEHWYEEYKIVDTENDQDTVSYYNKSLLHFYRQKILELSKYACDTESVIDIGCGVGAILELLLEKFEYGIGIEPSVRQIQLAKEALKKNIWEGYYEQIIVDNKFSAFFCTDLLEHLEKPAILLKKAYDDLKIGGVGYIAVPNGRKIFYENRWQDVLVEHVSYFSTLSLMYLLQSIGFYVIYLGETRNGWWLESYVRKIEFKASFNKKKQLQNDIIKQIIQEYSNIGIWGAGNKGSMLLRQLDFDVQKRVSFVFDKDLGKINKYIPGFGLKITFPYKECVNQCDIIVITALEYLNEIESELRSEYNYQGVVRAID